MFDNAIIAIASRCNELKITMVIVIKYGQNNMKGFMPPKAAQFKLGKTFI